MAIPLAWGVAWIFLKRIPDYPPGNDGSLYLAMAKGFAQGTGYHDITSPDPAAGTLQSPSFWPLLLSLYWRWSDSGLEGLNTLRFANGLLLSAAAVPCFFWLRLFLPAMPAFFIVMAFGASWATAFLGNSFMTETAFIPLLYGGLLLSQLGLHSAPGDRRGGAMRWVALLLWTLTARTRVIGWCFWAMYMILIGRRKEWPKLIAGLAVMAAWLLWERSMAAGIRVTQYQDGVFTAQYPLLVNLKAGALGLLGNLKDTLWSWSSAGQGHAMFPWLYYAYPMDKFKRIACLAIFAAVAWGFTLAWRSNRAARPWLLAMLAASAPTFAIFLPQDCWRYMHPFLPVSCLCLALTVGSLAARGAAAGATAGGKARQWMAGLGLVMIVSQAMHTWQRDMDDDYIDQSRDFRALHDSLLAMPVRPEIILSPDHYYTWLRTGIPSLNDYGRQHRLRHVVPYLRDRETWAIVGSANLFYVERWEREGFALRRPPKAEVRQWKAFKAEWEGEAHEPAEITAP